VLAQGKSFLPGGGQKGEKLLTQMAEELYKGDGKKTKEQTDLCAQTQIGLQNRKEKT